MPSSCKRADHWSSLPPPQTPLQQRTFMDACVTALLQVPDKVEGDALETLTHAEAPKSILPSGNTIVAGTRKEIRTRVPRACVLCGANDETVFAAIANPFAQRHLVLLCAACV